MMTAEEKEMYEQLIDMGIATAEEIELARGRKSGSWKDVLTSVLCVETGYFSIEEMLMAEEEE